MVCRAAVVVAAFTSLKQVSGILTAGDPNSSAYVVQPKDYPYFFSLRARGDCGGVIIGEKHAVTSAACLCWDVTAPDVILSDGSVVKPSNVFFNPECMYDCGVENEPSWKDGPSMCDVAVLEFDAALPAAASEAALPVYTVGPKPAFGEKGFGKSYTEYDQEIVILGFGQTGDAADGCVESDGKMRRATNIVTSASNMTIKSNTGGKIAYEMDEEIGEGMGKKGDRGGPAVITRDGIEYIAGVMGGVMGCNMCDPCKYGASSSDVRLSVHQAFIAKVMDPNDDSIAVHIDYDQTTTALPSTTTATPIGTESDSAYRTETLVIVMSLLWLHAA